MLQPSQLEDASVRYADEIAEMREFFATAGIDVGMSQALPQVAARLRDDRGFHRDLTSHVWVMLHRRGSAVRYGDTLGVLAIAAADKQQAAQADELIAHDLLRFVMEAHDRLNPPERNAASVGAKPVASVIPIRPVRDVAEPSVEAPGPESVAESKRAEDSFMTLPMLTPALVRSAPVVEEQRERAAGLAMDTPIHLSRMDVALAEEPEQRGKGLLWFALVAVLLVAAAGWWIYRHQIAEDTVATPAPVVEGTSVAPAEPAPAVVVAPEPPIAEASVAKLPANPKSTHHTHAVELPHTRPQPHKPELVPSYPAPAAMARSVAPAPVASAPNAANTPRPVTGVSAAPIVRSSPAARPGTATVSPNVLSKQLDRPGLTKEQEAEYDATGRRYPRLLRRTPAGSDTVQLAVNTMQAKPGAANSTPSTSGAVAGVVRPTSLGVMASNLIYSPAAAYPPAASAAHVTGAVKVEAVVDTSGNVANARVISGPPQLRDAALSAVQQWRYKPYVLGGKARVFTTQALMEFELP